MILTKLPLRGFDDWGSGDFGASRGSKKHKGIDYVCSPGDFIYSAVEGEITKFGYPYASALEFRYVEITDIKGNRCRAFYVEPDPELRVGGYLSKGYVMGVSQDIAEYYLKKDPMLSMKNHVHFEILDVNGRPINPNEYIS